MKRLFSLALFIAVAALPALATNNVNLIGLSANSVSMGGTGVANFTNSTDALYKNPALLPSAGEIGSLGVDITAGLIRQPEVGNFGSGDVNGGTGALFTGDVAASYRICNDFSIGVGFLPYAGAAADYTGQTSIFQPKMSLTLTKIMVGVAWKPVDWLTIGAAPFMTWGRFALNESAASAVAQQASHQTSRDPSSDLGFGGQFGVSVVPMPGLTFGATYTTRSAFTYNNLIDVDLFGDTAVASVGAGSPLDNFNLAQPDEFAVGVAWSPAPEWTITFDYRNIGWSRAEGYQDFGFASQNVVAIGGQYHMDVWRFRAGFNYAATPLSDSTTQVGNNITTVQGHRVYTQNIDLFDVFAFPGISTVNITAGIGYEINKDFEVNVAGIYSPNISLTRSGSSSALYQAASGLSTYNYKTTVSQWGVNATVSGKF